ncbi:hypothetical protein [Cupriavidus sp. IK-TO18]|uniref:hypothetical protein n=1 Tax=Cupriavidus sp. IK-TO18 TaxID=2782182 RepID=UPI001897CCED|nr:hypothetical protein [Cupriavidus sp. IK-TO18]MBF6986496.1 hypothetical protein [Cupriavidus sp. IK-TO18]
MYKGTRHTGQMWDYKSSSVHTSSFSSEAECQAILDRCKQTFVFELGVLQAADFQGMVAKLGSDKSKVMAVRLRRGKENLRNLGVPDNLIFAAPKHLLIAPKLGGLLSRLRRVNASRVPVELRGLHQHLNRMPEPMSLPREQEDPKSAPQEKVLFRVSKDGTRTAFTAKATPAERRRNHIYGGNAAPVPSSAFEAPAAPSTTLREFKPARRATKADSALALALKEALARKTSSK